MKKEPLPTVIAGHAVSTVGMAFIVIGSFACCRFCTDKAWAFSYPTRASTSQGSQSLNENLFRRYHQEITALKALLGSSQKKALSTESQRALSLAIHLKNQEELENLSRDTPLASVDRNRRVTSITREQAQEVLDSMASHPIVGEKAVSQYDPEGLNIGFCFGRAAYAHLELLRRGLSPTSIRKMFAMGSFVFQGQPWDFHVVTLVRGKENQWWSLDTATSTHVETPAVWMKNVEKLDKYRPYPRVRFYSTDAVKFQPWNGAYSPKNLYLPYFHNYFGNLAKWFDKNPIRKTDLFNQTP